MSRTIKRIGVLLAGGASKRMRRDKSSLKFDGESLFQRSCSLLNSLKTSELLDEVVISGGNRGMDINSIEDLFPAQGPVGGIFSIIQSLELKRNDLIMVMPVDMPLLDLDHLTQLIDVSARHGRTICYNNAWLPLNIVITRELLQEVKKQRIGQKGMSVRQVFELTDGQSIAPNDSNLLTNVNTPTQWSDLIKKLDDTIRFE